MAVVMDRDTGAKEKVEAEAGIPYLTALSTKRPRPGVTGAIMSWDSTVNSVEIPAPV